MSFDVAAVRAQFPIFRPGIHYLDNAATAQTPNAVLEATRDFETRRRANVLRGVHRLAEAATEAYENARAVVGGYVKADSPQEIVFTGNATAAINLVARGFGESLGPGDEVALSQAEHHANLVPWLMLKERRGVTLRYLPLRPDGRIDVSRAGEVITPRCKMLAVTHASNVTGAITDLPPLIVAAKRVGAAVLIDGAQMVSHGPLDAPGLGADFYAFSAHKMFGPTGIGVLWGRAERLAALPPLLGGGGMIGRVSLDAVTFAEPPRRFEAGTPPIVQAFGLATAARWVSALDRIEGKAHLDRLTGRILDCLAEVPGCRLVGPSDLAHRLPVISFVLDGTHPHDVCQILDRHGVAARGGHHCAQPLMAAFDTEGTTRISLAWYNDDGDVDAFRTGIAEAVKVLR